MRVLWGVLVCAVLAGAVPSLLPGDPRLAEGGDHHHGDHGDHHGGHGDHHGDHGDHHEDHGNHHADHGDHGEHHDDHDVDHLTSNNVALASETAFRVLSQAASSSQDYGAGIQVVSRPSGHTGHFNPFLPNYNIVGQTTFASNQRQFTGQPQSQFTGQPQAVYVSRPFIPIRPEDLNINPGVGESGQKDVVRAECGAGLVCVPEEQCDRYTGFVKGALSSFHDPSLPTVAIQRCRLGGGSGFCCQQRPRPASQVQQAVTLPAGQYNRGSILPSGGAADYSTNPFLG